MNRTGWLILGAAAVAVVLCGCIVLALLIPGLVDVGFYDRGPGMGHMFGDCPWCPGENFGSIGTGEILILLLVLAVPAGLLVLLVLGVIWLARSGARRSQKEVGEE